ITFGPPSSSFKWCHRCKKVGHLKEQCRKPPKNLNKIQCFRCGALGHIARQCLAPASLVSIPPFVSDTSGPQSATAPSIHPSATDPSIRPPASGSSIPPFVSDTSGPQSATAPSIHASAPYPPIPPPPSCYSIPPFVSDTSGPQSATAQTTLGLVLQDAGLSFTTEQLQKLTIGINEVIKNHMEVDQEAPVR